MPMRSMLSLTVTPGVPFRSTMKAVSPLAAGTFRSVRAKTMQVSAKPELVVKILEPLIIQSSPSFTAVVWAPWTSEPALVSVRPKHPTLLPSTRGRRYFCFCSSVPKLLMQEQHREVCTEMVMPVLASTLETSSMHRV